MKTILIIFLTTVAAGAVSAALPPGTAENVRSLLRERKPAEAGSAASALVAANPREAEAHALLASVCVARDDADGAVKAAETAVELAPANGEYQRQLGDAYGFAAGKAGMLGKMSLGKKCLAAYEMAVALDPRNLNARNSLMTVYQQAPGMMGGGSDKAYAQAAAIKQLDETRGRIAYAMLYTGEKKYAEAFAELDAALAAAPGNYPALYQFGRLAAISGERLDRGMEALKQCLALPPTAGSPGHEAAQWRLGVIWEKKGDKQAARAAYKAALAINPAFPQAIEALKKLD